MHLHVIRTCRCLDNYDHAVSSDRSEETRSFVESRCKQARSCALFVVFGRKLATQVHGYVYNRI